VYSLLFVQVFTRLTAGMLYMLYRVFKDISIKPFTSPATSGDRLVVCRNYKMTASAANPILEHLRNVCTEMDAVAVAGGGILFYIFEYI
jgi:hypothetical protein